MTENERRKFLKAAGASLAGAMGAGMLGCTPGGTPADTTEIRNPTREKLVERLKKLAESRLPSGLSPGAMCYQVAIPFLRRNHARHANEPCRWAKWMRFSGNTMFR